LKLNPFKFFVLLLVIISLSEILFPEQVPSCMLNYKFGKEKNVIIVEKSTQKLFIYSNYNIKPISTFVITTGKKKGQKYLEGDLKTPEGIYYFNRTLSGNQLPKIDDYGEKAFTMNYPNPIDKIENRKGSGIWLHGAFDSNKVKTPNSSRGCIVMNNSDLNKVSQYVFLKDTPIFVYNKIPYSTEQQIIMERNKFLKYIKTWKISWENKDIDNYINSYSSKFSNNDMDIKAFKQYKKRLNRIYKFIRVRLTDIAVYKYRNYYFTSFNQLYISDKNHFYSKKIQYWNTSNGRAKIAFETSISKPQINKIEISKGNYISIEKYRKNILNNKIEIFNNKKEFTSFSVTLNNIVLNKVEKKSDNIVLTLNKLNNIARVKIVPVLLIKKDNKTIYKSIEGISLKNGVPQNTRKAISLHNRETKIKIGINNNAFINSVNLFIFDKNNNFKQILTYFIKKQ